MDMFKGVEAFHTKFDLPVTDSASPMPHPASPDDRLFRANFLLEELLEYLAAAGFTFSVERFVDKLPKVSVVASSATGVVEPDHSLMFDALIDLVYVALGTAHLEGYPWPEGWKAVQAANMAKERSTSADDERSTRGNALDVVKPEGWTAPDIKGILGQHGWSSS